MFRFADLAPGAGLPLRLLPRVDRGARAAGAVRRHRPDPRLARPDRGRHEGRQRTACARSPSCAQQHLAAARRPARQARRSRAAARRHRRAAEGARRGARPRRRAGRRRDRGRARAADAAARRARRGDQAGAAAADPRRRSSPQCARRPAPRRLCGDAVPPLAERARSVFWRDVVAGAARLWRPPAQFAQNWIDYARDKGGAGARSRSPALALAGLADLRHSAASAMVAPALRGAPRSVRATARRSPRIAVFAAPRADRADRGVRRAASCSTSSS